MATDVERLAVLIEANTKSYERAMVKLQKQTDTASRNMERRFATAGKRLDNTFSDIGRTALRVAGTLGVAVGSAQAIRAVAAASQEYIALRNALKVVGYEGERLEAIQAKLFAIAQKNGTELKPLTELFGRQVQVQKELKASDEELLKFTEGVSLALRVQGGDAAQARGALLQLSQALASGTVRAEEFNSINEGALPIVQAVSRGLLEAGGSVGKLKSLIVDGKVSSEAFFRAFLAGSPQLAQQADKMQGTVGQATARMSNAFTLFIGKLDESLGSSKNAAENINGVASAIENLPKYVDAAVKGLGALNKELQSFGNSDVFKKINDFLAAGGLTETGAVKQQRFAAQQGNTEAAAAVRLLDLKERIPNIEARINELREKGGAINVFEEQRLATLTKTLDALKQEQAILNNKSQSAAANKSAAGGRIAEFALSPEGKAPVISPISLKDYAPPAKAKKGGNTVGVDSFERALASAQKRIEVLNAETGAIGLGTAARERAKVVAELETAAKAANAAAGMKNTEVTDAQRLKIDALASAQQMATQRNEDLTLSLKNQNDVLQFAGNQTIDLINSLGGTAEDRANALKGVLNSLIQALVKASLLGEGPLAGLLGTASKTGGVGGIFGMLGGLFGGARAAGGQVMPGKAYLVNEQTPRSEIFVPQVAGRIEQNRGVQGSGGGGAPFNYYDNRQFNDVTPDVMAKVDARIRASIPVVKQQVMRELPRQRAANPNFYSPG